MKRFLFFLLLYSLSINKVEGQCEIVIHQLGTPTDTIFVANYDDHQPQRINDSTYNLVWNTTAPERICLVLDRSTRWWTSIWIQPDIKHKEIIIDYTKKEMRLINGSEWDAVSLKWMGKFPYHGDRQSDSVAIAFVEKNPDSYLSLFFLTHGIYRDDPAKRKNTLAKLSPALKAYPEFKQAMASFNERKYPNTGDAFKEFELPDINDIDFNSNIIKNKWILLNFWSNGCGPCVKEIDDFVKLYNTVDTAKVQFICISLDENKTSWKSSKAANKIPWTNLWTPDNVYCDLCLNYNLFSMPFFVLFDNEKKLFYIKDGAGELENIKSTLKDKGLLK
jgi:thiol-disulfide isomerase/thioredoxin